jgi:hypothetical protein
MEARFGMIACYEHVGQHGEEEYLYYLNETVKATHRGRI